MDNEVIPGCSWYDHRFNVVPWGIKGHILISRFVDSLEEARLTKAAMLRSGAQEVDIYDTVEGKFFD